MFKPQLVTGVSWVMRSGLFVYMYVEHKVFSHIGGQNEMIRQSIDY